MKKKVALFFMALVLAGSFSAATSPDASAGWALGCEDNPLC